MNIYTSTSDADGTCHECRRISGRCYRVTVISMHAVTIQLCDSCLAVLRPGLATNAKQGKRKAGK